MSSLIGGDNLSGLSRGDLTPKKPQTKKNDAAQTLQRAAEFARLSKPEAKRTADALSEKATETVNRTQSGRRPL